MNVTKSDNNKATAKYALQKGVGKVVTGSFEKITSEAIPGGATVMNIFSALSDYIENGNVYKEKLPEVLPIGSYVVNQYVVKKNKEENYCAFTQYIATGSGNNIGEIEMDYWNPDNGIHSLYTSLYGYEAPYDYLKR